MKTIRWILITLAISTIFYLLGYFLEDHKFLGIGSWLFTMGWIAKDIQKALITDL